jgi:hypothetical protein
MSSARLNHSEIAGKETPIQGLVDYEMMKEYNAYAAAHPTTGLTLPLRFAHRDRQARMNIPLGYALLRDSRVGLRPKLIALGVGVAVTGLVELLQLPFESVFALLAPVVGAAGDIALDGAEVVILPVLVATALMPRLAPPAIVEQLRVERARPVS